MKKGYLFLGLLLVLILCFGLYFGYSTDGYFSIPLKKTTVISNVNKIVLDNNIEIKAIDKNQDSSPAPSNITLVDEDTINPKFLCTILGQKDSSDGSFYCKDYDSFAIGYYSNSEPTFYYYKNTKMTINPGCNVVYDECKDSRFLWNSFCRVINAQLNRYKSEDPETTYSYYPERELIDCKSYGENYTCHLGKCLSNCGNTVLNSGEECDDGNNNNGDGCSSECRLENKVDLIVKQIYSEVYSDDCTSSLQVEICNVGNSPLISNFDLNLSIYGGGSYINTYSVKYNSGMYSGDENGCVLLNDLDLMNTGKFGLLVNQDYNIVAYVDAKDEIYEENEQNNTNSVQITIPKLVYNDGSVCSAYCYDPDGLDFFNQYFIKTTVSSYNASQNTNATYLTDKCDPITGLYLYEAKCNGLEDQAVIVYCYEYGMACEDGRCVPKDGIVAYCDQNITDNPQNIYTKNSGFFSNINTVGNNYDYFEDYCTNQDADGFGNGVINYYCQGNVLYRFQKTCQCLDGACTYSTSGPDCEEGHDCKIKNYTCSDTDENIENQELVYGHTKLTFDVKCKFLGLEKTVYSFDSDWQYDTCLYSLDDLGTNCESEIYPEDNPNCKKYGPTLIEKGCSTNSFDSSDYCNPLGLTTTSVDCTEQGLMCNQGRCQEPLEKVASVCSKPAGINYDHPDVMFFKNDIGVGNDYVDKCLDNVKLLEYNCDDLQTANWEIHNCSSEGKLCNMGRCISQEELDSLMAGDINSGEITEYCAGDDCYSVEDEFCLTTNTGIVYGSGDSIHILDTGCVNNIGGIVDSSNDLFSWSCDGLSGVGNHTNCALNGDYCEDAECK